jgi:hypothetical protein
LTREHGGNVHDQGIVIVTGTSANDGPRNAPKNVADLQTDTWFFSSGEPNQWISYNFRTARVRLTEYSIRTYHGNYHLKSWVIEGSDDGQTWTQIDRRSNTNDLNGWDKFRTYGVSTVVETRILRLRQTGKSHSGDDYLAFSAWELFGTLLEH